MTGVMATTVRPMPEALEVLVRKAKANWRRRLSRARIKARTATGYERIAAIANFTRKLNSQERPRELLALISTDPPESFWPIFLTEWSSCDSAWQYQSRFARILRRVGPCPSEVYSRHAEDGGAFYTGLPERLVLYRGSDRTRIDGGISWTTNPDVALRFAHGHRGMSYQSPAIATATISKADIFAAINDRGEDEIICLPKVEQVEPIDPERRQAKSRAHG